MPSSSIRESFIEALNSNQGSLYGYIYSLLRDHHGASDVLQESNLVLWDKIDEFRVGAPFLPWAFAIARFQVMAYLRDQKRRRKVLLDSDTVELLAEDTETAAQHPEMEKALVACMEKLPQKQRSLVNKRYFQGMRMRELSEAVGQTESALKSNLFRIRKALRSCIDRKIKLEDKL